MFAVLYESEMREEASQMINQTLILSAQSLLYVMLLVIHSHSTCHNLLIPLVDAVSKEEASDPKAATPESTDENDEPAEDEEEPNEDEDPSEVSEEDQDENSVSESEDEPESQGEFNLSIHCDICNTFVVFFYMCLN